MKLATKHSSPKSVGAGFSRAGQTKSASPEVAANGRPPRLKPAPTDHPFWRAPILWAFLCLFVASFVHAHDIPADITLQAFLKPEGQKLHLLVRVPLKAMRDIEFPKRGPGYLDLTRVDEYLRDAGQQWISNFTEIDE